VSEQDRYLTLLPGHQLVPTDPTQSELYFLLKISNIDPDYNGKVWVPLIPGYTIFTSLSGIFLQLSIETKDETLLYRLTEYGTDYTFSNPSSTQLFDKFRDIRQYILSANHINYKGNISIPWLLGLTCTDNVQWLRGFISITNPDLFPEAHIFFKANQRRNEILNLGTRSAYKIDKEFQKNDGDSMDLIMEGIEVNRKGWDLNKKTVQGLGVRLHHTECELRKNKKRVSWLLEKIDKLNNQLEDQLSSSEYVLHTSIIFISL